MNSRYKYSYRHLCLSSAFYSEMEVKTLIFLSIAGIMHIKLLEKANNKERR